MSLAVALGTGCAQRGPRGGEVVHVVAPGETVWRIAQRYGTDAEAVIRANGIQDVRAVAVGTRLRIPRAADPSGSRAVPARYEPEPAFAREADAEIAKLGLAFAWPLRGTLNSIYGGRKREGHDGVDIGAPEGTPVRAAEAGKVIYSGRLGDYGNLVILKHVGSVSSVYAHGRRNLACKGQFVERGDVIAEVGDTGNASGHHLHFEIRVGQTAVDPLRYLP